MYDLSIKVQVAFELTYICIAQKQPLINTKLMTLYTN